MGIQDVKLPVGDAAYALTGCRSQQLSDTLRAFQLATIGDRTEMQTHDQDAQQALVRNGLDVRVGDVSASLYCCPLSGRQSSASAAVTRPYNR